MVSEDELLDGYPNLSAVLDGRVSGQATEWPVIRRELMKLAEQCAAKDKRIAELEAGQQAAIDGAMEGVIEHLKERGRRCNVESTEATKRANGAYALRADRLSKEADSLFRLAASIESKFIGTNPLADLQAKVRELEAEMSDMDECIDHERNKNRQLQAENAELRADAERYRWLREQHWADNTIAAVQRPKDALKLGHYAPSHERLDELIDAALRQRAEQDQQDGRG